MTGKVIAFAFGLLFSIYSFSCTFFINKNYAPFLKIIAIANGIYILIAFIFLIHHFSEITKLGISYFVAEAQVVALVIGLEWQVATRYSTNSYQS